ncbi:GPI inositol deacylase [Paramarasmius palmivorus]|uniref:GPI inositol-deacylase n=1 Tax=Paramarasmius palmivorus TaxID=297713 RepID=A0AAW0DEY0_9AGAR
MSRVVTLYLAIWSLAVVALFLIATLEIPESLSPQGCRMSWMSPSYIVQSNFNSTWTPLGSRYSLVLYREVGWETNELWRGTPVLFIPGNAGSSKQVRSIASSAARQYFSRPGTAAYEFVSRGLKPLDFFAVEFNEDLSAFHGPTVEAQTDYTSQAIKYVLSMYPKDTKIIIMGHSMGGIVATSLLPSQDIAAIITMSTPHTLPPARFDQRIDYIYGRNREVLDRDPVPILSLCGGATDMMIPSESCILPAPANVDGTDAPLRATVFTSALEGAWTGVGHREMVWCHQVRWRVARAALELSGAKSIGEIRIVLDKWLRDGHSLPLLEPGSSSTDITELSEDDTPDFLPAGIPLTLKQPRGSRTYLLPVMASPSLEHFVLFVSQGSIPPVAPQHPNSLQVSVKLCTQQNGGAIQCNRLTPSVHKLIPNPVPGKTFPVPHEGSDESEGVVLFEADVPSPSNAEQTWIAVHTIRAEGDGWVLGGLYRDPKIVNPVSTLGLLFGPTFIDLHNLKTSKATVTLPNLLSHALVVYRVSSRYSDGDSHSDSLLHPLMVHTSSSVETHYFPLTLPMSHRLLIHTHGTAPYVRTVGAKGIELTVYSSDVPGQLQGVDLSIDWKGTLGRWSTRYFTTLACWAVGVVSLLMFEVLAIGDLDGNGSIPTVHQSLQLFCLGTLPKLVLGSFVMSWIPLPPGYYLGNSGEAILSPIAPLMLSVAAGLVCVSWALLNVCMWPLGKVSLFLSRKSREEINRARRGTVVSMCLLFVLIFFFIPWQVAYLCCWVIHFHTCASAPSVQTSTQPEGSIPLLDREVNVDHDDGYRDEEQKRRDLEQASVQRLIRASNANYNSHLLLFMTWLLPLAAPVLVVWVRTLATAGLTTPFDGDHFFLNAAPFLILVDFATWNSGPIFGRSSSCILPWFSEDISGI